MRLPYFPNPLTIVERLAAFDDVTLLDSGDSERGRWDIIAAGPDTTLTLAPAASDAEIEEFVHELLALEAGLQDQLASAPAGYPFAGGLIGFLSYELGRRLRGFAPRADCSQPLAVVRLHPWAIVQDRWNDEAMLVGVEGSNHEISYRIERLLSEEPHMRAPPLALSQPFRSDWDFADYEQRFAAVQRYIVDGDCYQINLGQRFEAPYSGSVHAAYRSLRNVAKAPFSALVPLDSETALLCLSPERFLTVDGTRVSTHPIKGTRPRSADPVEDQRLAKELLNSAKERAENLMIVDLLRNDIGRFCTAGSVFVEELFRVESYATVHHLVSHVRATLGGDTSPLALLLGCMPGGSITGAPKHRAMQLIDELEAAPRESWCGTVFYRCARGRLDSNILIRTVHADGKKLSCWAGGGLVADSKVKDEYEELEHKVGALLRALEAPLVSG